MPAFKFTVDSALLKELGERLVGKPHIALAELVKNGYDADALTVVVKLDQNSLTITDNGHGMSPEEFEQFWMRIGSPHKGREGYSRDFRRPLTGSKGVGRLAGQFLARKMTIHTVSKNRPEWELVGRIDWERASEVGDLTEATVEYEEGTRTTVFAANARHGTKIVLEELNQEWIPESIADLAREIWWLQPPFRSNSTNAIDRALDFSVRFETEDHALTEAFESQMKAILSLYYVKITGRLNRDHSSRIGVVSLAIEWEDGPVVTQEYEVPNCALSYATFEIRVYHLQRRQKYGVAVQEAREYLNEHGQVHIYDAGFHLPYYGPQQDWLGVERDHAHRLSKSSLLPPELQVSHGLNYLPTGSRLLGVVHVDTGHEKREAEKQDVVDLQSHLMVQITRDRLVDNTAFQNLVFSVRWALDFYAMQEAAKEFEQKRARAKTEPVLGSLDAVEHDIELLRDQVDANTIKRLEKNIRLAIEGVDEDNEQRTREVGLLASLATAGMAAVAFRHEINRQLVLLRSSISEIRRVSADHVEVRDQLNKVANDLEEWHATTTSTQSLFFGISDRESREKIERWKAKPLIESVCRQVKVMAPFVDIDSSAIDLSIRVPEGTYIEWTSMLQNLLVNASNAVIDVSSPLIKISSMTEGSDRALFIQDNGKGVDLSTAEELFKPFVRKLILSRSRQAMSVGGSGIGLTIVRMLAENLKARVEFVPPDDGFKTCVAISWREAR